MGKQSKPGQSKPISNPVQQPVHQQEAVEKEIEECTSEINAILERRGMTVVVAQKMADGQFHVLNMPLVVLWVPKAAKSPSTGV